MKIKFCPAVRDAFWRVARGQSILAFDNAFKELHSMKPSDAQYLQAIDPVLNSVSRFPGIRFQYSRISQCYVPERAVDKLRAKVGNGTKMTKRAS